MDTRQDAFDSDLDDLIKEYGYLTYSEIAESLEYYASIYAQKAARYE